MKVIELICKACQSGHHVLHRGQPASHTHRVSQGANMHTNSRASDAAHVIDVRNHQMRMLHSRMLQYIHLMRAPTEPKVQACNSRIVQHECLATD